MTDDHSVSVASCGSRSLAAASIHSHSSRSILKKKTVFESLDSSLHSVGSVPTCVTFDSVEINCHPITLGVNPSVADGGPPIEIEWECQSYHMTSVDDFEQARAEGNSPRTIKKLSPEDRIDLLIKSGFTREDLDKTEDEMSNIRLSREMSRRQERRRQCSTEKSQLRRCNTAPPKIESTKSSNLKDKGGTSYGKLIKKFRLKRSESKMDRQ